jgi:DNA-directed RNA polymerase subunit M/transcription elongation factor TFIIS
MFGGFEDIENESDDDTEDEIEEDEIDQVEVEEEEEEEEETDDEEEEEAEVVDEYEAQEEVVPVRATRVRAAKKKKQNTATLSSTNSHIILDIPLSEHLQPDEGTQGTQDPKRLESIQLLSTIFKKNNIKGIDATVLEKSIFNISIVEAKKRHVTPHWTCKMFQYIYTTKIRHITGNLIPGSYIENKYLLTEVQKGKQSIEEVAALSPYSMNNDLWKDYIHRQQQREKSQLEGNKAMATDQFLCGRCHKRECTYYEMQTRSADEPMTIFITCLNCGKHWRQ